MNTIFITGANRGLGLEMTRQYLEIGWRVIATCRNASHANKLIQLATNPNLRIIPLEVTNEKDIHALTQQLKNEKIDILMNNAGIIGGYHTKLGEITQDECLQTITINAISPLLIAQVLINQVANSEKKIIANMSSSSGSITDNTEGGHYSYNASKSALNAVTKSLAIDLQPKNIIVVSLDPGWVKTDLGGEHADLDVEESVTAMRNLLSRLTLKDSGTFIRYDGKMMAW